MSLRLANRLRPHRLGSARIGLMAGLASVVGVRNTPNRRQCSTRRFGVALEHEDHGDGVGHAAGELGAIRIAVISADRPGESPAWRCGGSTFVGMWVPSLDAATGIWSRLRRRCYCRTSKCESGCHTPFANPDGRGRGTQPARPPRPMEGHPTTENHEGRYDVPVTRQVIPQLSNRLAPDSRVQLRPHRPESRSSFEAPRTTLRYPK